MTTRFHLLSLATRRIVWLLSIMMLPLLARAENNTFADWAAYGVTATVSTTDDQNADVYKNNTTYTVKTPKGLAWIAEVTNKPTTYSSSNAPNAPAKAGFEGCTVLLGADLDLSGSGLNITDVNWRPIGSSETITFLGTFDGKGKTVSGMSFSSETTNSTALKIGLFGAASGIIQNLVVKGEITLKNKTGDLYAAGIAALLSNGTIRNCISHVAINIDNAKYMCIGGIAGRYEKVNGTPTITNCYSTGNIEVAGTANNNIYVGGIAGYGELPVSYCYSTASITAGMVSGEKTDYFYIGGIIGSCYDTPAINNCFALNTGGITAIKRFRIFGKENGSAKLSKNYASGLVAGNQGYKTSFEADGKSVFLADAPQTLTSWANEAFSTSDNNLPKLKMINDNGSTYGEEIPGQENYAIANYFKNPANWSEYGETADVGDNGDDVAVSSTNYTIKTAKGLAWIAWVTNDNIIYKVNAPESVFFPASYNFQNCTLTLGESFALSKPESGVDADFDTNWIPIGLGDWLKGSNQNVFRGTVNGNGTTISDLTITPVSPTAYKNVGLFGRLITGSISKLRVTGNIKVSSEKAINAGGFIGDLLTSAPITNCISEVNVEATSTGQGTGVYAGGIIGEISGTNNSLTNCYSTGDITSTSTNTATGSYDSEAENVNAGGIVGGNYSSNSGTISKCFATGAITATGTNANKINVGGIVGYAYQNLVENCLALNKTITLNASPKYLGRVVGRNRISMKQAYASTKIAGTWKNKSKTDIDGANFYQEDDLETLFGSDDWTFTDKNLPTLTAFTNQPTFAKSDYLESRADIPLTLPSNGSSDVITLKYDNGKWTYQIGSAAEQPFNGTISKALGTTIPGNQLHIASTTGTPPASLTFDKVEIYKTDANPAIKVSAGVTVEIKTSGDCYLRTTTAESTIDNAGSLTVSCNEGSTLYVTGNTSPSIKNAEGATLGNSWLEWEWKEASSSTYFNFFKDGNTIIQSMTPFEKVFAIIASSGNYTIKSNNYAQKAYNADNVPVLTFTPEEGKVVTYTNVSASGTVAITEQRTYGDGYKDLPIIVKNGGIFNITADDASIYSLTIEPGGQVKTDKPLKVFHDFTAYRTLDNKWSTFASPVEMTASAESTVLYTVSGYLETEPEKQGWEDISGQEGVASADLEKDKPYLIASEANNTTVTIKATGVTIPKAEMITLGESLDNGVFLFTANNTLQQQTLSNVYVLNAEKNRFDLVEGRATIQPMQAFAVANAVTRATTKSLLFGSGMATGNKPVVANEGVRIWGTQGTLHIRLQQRADVSIFNASGQLLRLLRAASGEIRLPLTAGIYFIHCNQITYKVAL